MLLYQMCFGFSEPHLVKLHYKVYTSVTLVTLTAQLPSGEQIVQWY